MNASRIMLVAAGVLTISLSSALAVRVLIAGPTITAKVVAVILCAAWTTWVIIQVVQRFKET